MTLLGMAGAHQWDLWCAATPDWAAADDGDFNSGAFTFNFANDSDDAEGDVVFKDNAVIMASNEEVYVRFLLYAGNFPDAGEVICVYFFQHTGSADHSRSLWVNDAGKLELREGAAAYVGTTLIGTSTTAMSAVREIETYWNNTNGGVIDQLKVDGSLEIDDAGAAEYDVSGRNMYALRFGMTQAKGENAGGWFLVKNITVNDGAGTRNNGWPEDWELGHAELDGNHGAPYQDYVDAGAAQADHEDWNDPQTGHDGDTTFAESGAADAAKEHLSTLETAAAAGVDGINYHVDAIQTILVWKQESGSTETATECGVLVRDNGSNIEQKVNAESAAYGDDAYLQPVVRVDEVMPDDGAAWLTSRVTAFAVGAFRTANYGDRNMRVTAVYVTYARLAGAAPSENGVRRIFVC